jgi:hypothetical protein
MMLHNCEQFIGAIDVLQATIDDTRGSCPIKLFGDFNAQLPIGDSPKPNWFRRRGFSNHSRILFDFLVANDMKAVDLNVPQCVKFTYFNVARNVNSWIDHVIACNYDRINNCYIIGPCADNVSDHLPIGCRFDIRVHCAASPWMHPRPSLEFWRRCRKPRKDPPSTLSADDKAAHYHAIMTDNGVLTSEQAVIADRVNSRAQLLHAKPSPCIITPERIADAVDGLTLGCAPGIDCVTAEHLKYGKSRSLYQVLADVFSCCITWGVVPTVFTLRVIVPILKKPSSDPSDANSYTDL